MTSPIARPLSSPGYGQGHRPAAPVVVSARGRAASTPAPAPIRVVVCDDSAVIRSVLCRLLASNDAISVVGRASNGREAVEMIRNRPNLAEVMVLDIEMPLMDGLTALPLLHASAPDLRVIIASTLTTRGAATTMEALRLGALDYVPKPSAASLAGDVAFQRELLTKVIGLGRRSMESALGSKGVVLRLGAAAPKPRLLAIGSSTGGPQALVALLKSLCVSFGSAGLEIPAVLTQHMPPAFTPLLAEQLTRLGGIPTVEAVDGAILEPGRLHVAPGGRHLLVTRQGEALVGRLDDGVPENFCRPSVDPMLRSAAAACDGRVLMLMLTGMGHDGLAGTQALIAAGGTALAQDEASSVVWGMPGAIARAGLCQAVLTVPAMAEHAVRILRGAA